MSKYNFYVEDVSVEAILNKLGGVEGAKRFLSNELLLTEAPKSKPAPNLEPVVDLIIRVDRSVKPAYPEWVKEVLYPELQGTGPIEYSVAGLAQWLHDGQKSGKWTKGEVIYEYLKEKKMLQSCLGLSDLLAIQAKGIAFFRQHFAGKAIFGWKSVVRDRDGYLFVPYLCEDGDEVVLVWCWLDNDWRGNSPALRFAS